MAETQITKQGIVKVVNDGSQNENLLLNSYGVIIDKQNNTLDSRTEYYAWDVGQSYMNIATTTNVIISFDLEMLVRDVSGYNGQLLVYNTNNKGPIQLSGISYYFKKEYNVGNYINKRIFLKTTLVPRESPTQQKNYIEFYTGYGTNNFYKISNVKLEEGSIATPWIPNSNDNMYSAYNFSGASTNSGFIELDNTARIYKERIDANQFYEI